MYRKPWNYKNGKTKNSAGYIMVLCKGHPGQTKNGYVYEHRLVMEDHLGRLLLSNEHIHHINGNKSGMKKASLDKLKDVIKFFKKGIEIKKISKLVHLSEPTVSKLIKSTGREITNNSRRLFIEKKLWLSGAKVSTEKRKLVKGGDSL